MRNSQFVMRNYEAAVSHRDTENTEKINVIV